MCIGLVEQYCDFPLIYQFKHVFLGAQKNCLTETVLLSTHNIWFGSEIRKIIFSYASLSLGLNPLLHRLFLDHDIIFYF